MNSLVLLIAGIVIFLVAYICYGGYLAKKWGVTKNDIETPAHRFQDNTDYVPTEAPVLFGHHFSSIAGAGPITGPALAAVFGWVPVYLWIVIGSVFFGGVHDFGALAASLDNDGKSVGEIIKTNVSKRAQTIFNCYAWITLTLVVAAFTDMCAKAFAYNPADAASLVGAQAGTASILFIVLAVLFGFSRRFLHANLTISTILGVILIGASIVIGYYCPVIKMNVVQWRILLIIYIAAASVLPVWLLLQPRDYLCSFLLYAMMAGAILGVFIKHPTVQLTPFAGFNVNGNSLFPFLFVTVACGAVSGFHSLIASGTTSKQLDKRSNAKLVGYGSMLVEGLLAIVTLIVVCYLSKDGATDAVTGAKLGAPSTVFARGISEFMNTFGIPLEGGRVFVILAYSAFALTSLDTATRIGRYLMQELAGELPEGNPVRKAASNMYIATGLTIAVSVIFLVAGYQKIWPIFGSANQLLAALALLAITAWMYKKGTHSFSTIIPMIVMFAVTFTALVLIIIKNFQPNGFIPLAVVGIVLFALAVIQLVEATVIIAKGYKNNAQ